MRLHLWIGLIATAVLCGGHAWAEEGGALRTAPLMRGTLWWITYEDHAAWTRAEFDAAIGAQQAVGFDVLWVLNTPQIFQKALDTEADGECKDLMGLVYDVADGRGMHVLADVPKGGWYGQTIADEMCDTIQQFVVQFHDRYGEHASFYGWYLNHEINPIAPEDKAQSAYWRGVWRRVVETCHRTAPGSVVTISPFFLLDEPRRRGFVYLAPEQYAAWWGKTLEATGIDVLMLQDSGEHLSFFTLEQREPFFAAVAAACREAGAEFWVNVETGEADVADWDEFLALSREGTTPWRFTPMPWLEKKLRLAARYADGIINWGYFPYMAPGPSSGKVQSGRQDAYAAYKAYFERMRNAGASLPRLPQSDPAK